MRFLILAFLFFTFPTQAFSAKGKGFSQSDAPITIDRGPSKRLFIAGYSGQVIVTASSKTNEIIVKPTHYIDGDDSPEAIELLKQVMIKTGHTGDTVEVRVQLPPNRTEWPKWAQGKAVPQVRLEISAPESMNLEIYLARGDVRVAKWRAPVVVTSQNGRLALEDISGDVTLRSMYGLTKIENVRGSVSVENFASSLGLTGINGKLKLRTFSGDAHIKKVSGAMVLSSQKGLIISNDTSGTLDIQTGVAAIKILNHRGTLRGQSETGAIEAMLVGNVDARLSSVSGPLSLSVPRSSRAEVALSSNKGELRAPKSLDHKRTSAGKVVRGNLAGTEGGAIRLTSDSGDLSLKTM